MEWRNGKRVPTGRRARCNNPDCIPCKATFNPWGQNGFPDDFRVSHPEIDAHQTDFLDQLGKCDCTYEVGSGGCPGDGSCKKVHNHGIDPSCREVVVDGRVVGECMIHPEVHEDCDPGDETP